MCDQHSLQPAVSHIAARRIVSAVYTPYNTLLRCLIPNQEISQSTRQVRLLGVLTEISLDSVMPTKDSKKSTLACNWQTVPRNSVICFFFQTDNNGRLRTTNYEQLTSTNANIVVVALTNNGIKYFIVHRVCVDCAGCRPYWRWDEMGEQFDVQTRTLSTSVFLYVSASD